jgi:uncharacterized protein (DUF302 family)
MTRLPGGVLAVFLCAGAGIGGCATPAADPGIYERSTAKPVAETVEDVEFAVTERNFRITGQLHVGKGIRERDRVGFPEHEVVLFCNLGVARRMLELDPGFINYCPGRVAVRESAGTTYISAPLLPESPGQGSELAALVRRINGLIREIVDYGTEQWSGVRP